MLLAVLVLVSCATSRNPYPRTDLTNENWVSLVDTNPNHWAVGADRWFMTGDPNATEVMVHHAPDRAAISTMAVRVPDFTGIRTNGDFQVQIYGTYDHNAVYVYGPNAGVRQVVVEVRNNVLCISQIKNATRETGRVIVRIGVVNLQRLTHQGCGTVEGRQLRSTGLYVVSAGQGNMYLAGNMNLHDVLDTNKGSISIFGAVSAKLNIRAIGSGSVNISGNIGLNSILHKGSGDINLIGVSGHSVKINAMGKGKIGLLGNADISEIRACDSTCVFAYCLNSDSLYVYTFNSARVGLAGRVNHLYVDTTGSSRFGGRYLQATDAYVRTRDGSHANIMAVNRMFASATNNGSVYFYGSPDIMSQFVNGNGTVIPIWYKDGSNYGGVCMIGPHPTRAVYKGQDTRHERYYQSPKRHVRTYKYHS
jgi:hypothetical protein